MFVNIGLINFIFLYSMVDSDKEEYEMDLRMRANSSGGNDVLQQHPTLSRPSPQVKYPSSEESSLDYTNATHSPNEAPPDFFSNYDPRSENRGFCGFWGCIEE